MRLIRHLKTKAAEYRCHLRALYIACRDPRTPWLPKAIAALVVAYALSPVDLIPDVIPVLGYLDDLVLLPLGIMLAIRLIPPPVLEESRKKAREETGRLSPSRSGLALVLFIWMAVVAGMWGIIAGLL